MNPTTIDGIQRCLMLEHEAIWVYGVLGGQLPSVRDKAREAFNEHRRSRDILIAMLDAESVRPVAPQPEYAVPAADTPEQASKVARSIEQKSAGAWLEVVGTDDDEDRAFAITMLRKAALAELVWGAAPTAFPGLPAER